MTDMFTTVHINYGKHEIPIDVYYEERNQLVISVRPDMTVEARAPFGSTTEKVHEKLVNKARWIWHQLNHFEHYQPLQPPRKYISGETHLYLGRQYRLKIEHSQVELVRLIGKFFCIETKTPEETSTIKSLMLNWYQSHARVVVHKRLDYLLPDVERYGAQRPEVRFQWMNKRWGSCTPKNILTVNYELVKAPIHCVDYVLMHELCHLVHHNHSPEFYRLMNILMPDWQKRRQRLDSVII